MLAVSSSSPATNQKSLHAGPFERLRICPTHSHMSDSNKGSSVPNHLLIRLRQVHPLDFEQDLHLDSQTRSRMCGLSFSRHAIPSSARDLLPESNAPEVGCTPVKSGSATRCPSRIQQHRPRRVHAIHWKGTWQKRHEKVAHEAVPRESEEAIPRASCPRGGEPKRDFRDRSKCTGGTAPSTNSAEPHALCKRRAAAATGAAADCRPFYGR